MTEDNELIRAMAEAIYRDCCGWFDETLHIGPDDLEDTARAALTACRNHEVEL